MRSCEPLIGGRCGLLTSRLELRTIPFTLGTGAGAEDATAAEEEEGEAEAEELVAEVVECTSETPSSSSVVPSLLVMLARLS